VRKEGSVEQGRGKRNVDKKEEKECRVADVSLFLF